MLFLHSRGWCDGTGGNFSVCLQHDPLQLLMAPSGVDKGSVQAEELIVVDARLELGDDLLGHAMRPENGEQVLHRVISHVRRRWKGGGGAQLP